MSMLAWFYGGAAVRLSLSPEYTGMFTHVCLHLLPAQRLYYAS